MISYVTKQTIFQKSYTPQCNIQDRYLFHQQNINTPYKLIAASGRKRDTNMKVTAGGVSIYVTNIRARWSTVARWYYRK